MTLDGTGGAAVGPDRARGVSVFGAATTISAGSGGVSITGTKGSAGIEAVVLNGTSVTATGGGAIGITASGQLIVDTNVSAASNVTLTTNDTAGDEDLSIASIAGAFTVESTSADVTIDGGDDVLIGTGGAVEAAGDVTITADDLTVDGAVAADVDVDLFSTNGTRTIALGSGPAVKGSGIDTGSAAYGLDDAELDRITAGRDRRVIGNAASDQININYDGGDSQPLNVWGLAGDDEFFVAPSTTLPLNLLGGDPAAPTTPGDTLHLDMSGTLPPVIVDTIGGFAISSNSAVVSFGEFETLELCDDSGDIDNADIGDLYVRTRNTRERIVFTLWNDQGVKLRIDDLTNRSDSITYTQHFGLVGGVQMLQQLLVYAQDGNDLVAVASHVRDGNGDPIPVEFHGEDGDDYLAGGLGDDLLVGGPGRDRVLGGEGDNSLFGDGNEFAGTALIELTTDGPDYLAGRSGNDVIWGGGDRDRLSGSSGDDVLNGGSGADLLDGGRDTDILRGGSGNDTLNGSYGDDFLLGGLDNDRLYGRSGNDIAIGGAGADELRGDQDNDLVVAGTTSNDGDSDAALLALLASWSGSGVDPLSGHAADGDADRLRGGSGVDEFWAEITSGVDSVLDDVVGESLNDEP